MCTVLGDTSNLGCNRPMARKRTSSNNQSHAGRSADAFDIASGLDPLLSPVSPSTVLSNPLKNDPALEIEDRRSYSPEGPSRRPKSRSQTTQIVVRDRKPSPRQALYKFKLNSQTKAVVAFAQPNSVVLCQRRKARRQVLFAKRKTRGAGGRPRRRNWTTYISCR